MNIQQQEEANYNGTEDLFGYPIFDFDSKKRKYNCEKSQFTSRVTKRSMREVDREHNWVEIKRLALDVIEEFFESEKLGSTPFTRDFIKTTLSQTLK